MSIETKKKPTRDRSKFVSDDIFGEIKKLRNIISKDDTNADSWYELAKWENHYGSLGDACSSFEMAAKHAPENIEYNLQAIAYHIRLIRTKTNHTFWNNLARQGHSKELVDRALEYKIDLDVYNKEMGRALYRNGNSEVAHALLNSAYATYPNDADLNDVLGNIAMDNGEYGQAIKFHRKLAEFFPSDTHCQMKVAKALDANGDREEAEVVFRTAYHTAMLKGDSDAEHLAWHYRFNGIGDSYAAPNDQQALDAAIEAYETKKIVCANAYADFLCDSRGDLVKAEAILRRVSEHTNILKDTAKANLAYFFYHRKNDLPAAEKIYKELADANTSDPDVYGMLSVIYKRYGYPQDEHNNLLLAEKFIQEANPKHTMRGWAQTRLYALEEKYVNDQFPLGVDLG